MKKKEMNEFPLISENEGIPLFYPHTGADAQKNVIDTLSTRWIGQGPKVDLFESRFKEKFLGNYSPVAVGSGTDALHLAYILAGINPGDEVIVPLFTCTATNIPLLYIGAKPIFVDVDLETMNISIADVYRKISKKTKAVVCVDYGGVPCDYTALRDICDELRIPLISDAAHSLGSTFKGRFASQYADYTIFSFQAIKTLTTGDGGLLAIKDESKLERARRLRWFGIDRTAKQRGVWENDIVEVGYKYQMNDIAAAIGLAGLAEIDTVIEKRNTLFRKYEECLKSERVRIVGRSETDDYFNSSWLITVVVDDDRYELMKKLRENNIESAQVHYRNDRYSIFGQASANYENMDSLEDKYLVLPLHTRMSSDDVERISNVVNGDW